MWRMTSLRAPDVLSLDQEVGVADAVLLDPLTEDAFIVNLHQRFKRDQIYTYIGSVVVSVNPYKKLAFYTPQVIQAYRTRSMFELPPHIYALGENVCRALRDRTADQCVLVSGESGSGKTDASKHVLNYITSTREKNEQAGAFCVNELVTQSHAILEAFGNAKTHRNDNSSRFGKYWDVEFDFKGEPLGASITIYLLEKSRVSSRSQGERNFHVFYQLLTGADVQLLKMLKLQRNLDNYFFLRNSKPHVDSIDDKNNFQITKKAMEIVRFSQEDIVNVFKIVAAILKLGNIDFIPASNIDGTEGCNVSNEYELYEICELLQVDLVSLQRALVSRTIETRQDTVVADLSATEAACGRDALCKSMYNRLFTQIVNDLNDEIKVKEYGKRKVLGLLDIYGFETFEYNTFEQFIINFSNEKLHQVFVDLTLRENQEEYIREGIYWMPVEYFNNSTICELIEMNNHGILALLEDECLKPGHVSDHTFLAKLAYACTGHPHFEARSQKNFLSDNSLPHDCFRLKHYAGTVTYNVAGFTDKNNDSLRRDLSQVMYCCNHPMLKTLFPEGNPKRPALRRPATVGTQFKISISALLKNLSSKEPHYVRCIKPNEMKQPRIFELALIQHQVRYLGLVETVRVRRAGYSWRETYENFLSRYKLLSPYIWPVWKGSAIDGCSYLLRDLPIATGEYALGRTKIFIKSPKTVYELEEYRRERLEDLCVLIQKTWRGWRTRRRFCRMKYSQITIAATWKSYKAKGEFKEMKRQKQVEWAVSVIQRSFVCWKRRRFLLHLAHGLPSSSPACKDWLCADRFVTETSHLLRLLHHKWRCQRYRMKFDQISRNRMREKVTASIIFKDRKASYAKSVSHPFVGDYVRLRQNAQWKKVSVETNDQYVVFADIINKITRSSGKFVPILFVISTSSMLIMDQRTMQVKYRIPAAEIFRLSLSPYLDDIAVFHVRAMTPPSEVAGSQNVSSGCLFQSEIARKKGDFMFQTGHVIEIVTKLFLVVQNATGKPPDVHIGSEFNANFGQQTVYVTFKTAGLPEVQPGQLKIVRKSNRMEVIL